MEILDDLFLKKEGKVRWFFKPIQWGFLFSSILMGITSLICIHFRIRFASAFDWNQTHIPLTPTRDLWIQHLNVAYGAMVTLCFTFAFWSALLIIAVFAKEKILTNKLLWLGMFCGCFVLGIYMFGTFGWVIGLMKSISFWYVLF